MNSADDPPVHSQVIIRNKRGLHARASAKFVTMASAFEARVTVSRNGMANHVDGTSIMGLMMLAAAPGDELTLSAQGRDAQQAIDALQNLIETKFDEE